MSEPRFTTALIGKEYHALFLISGMAANRQTAYSYLAVPLDKVNRFLDVRKNTRAQFTPADFGTVLAQGYGEPPDEVKERMTREYGFDHEKAARVPELPGTES